MSEPPTSGAAGESRLFANLVRFGRILRRLGLGTTSAEISVLAAALESVPLRERRAFRDAARAILVHRREHLATFERAFDLFWSADALLPRQKIDLGRMLERRQQEKPQVLALGPDVPGHDPDVDVDATLVERHYTWSDRERLRRKDFADLTPEEEATIRRLLHEERLRLEPRRTRRLVAAADGAVLDLRATLRRSLVRGGEPIDLAWRRRKSKRRPLVVLSDISGSMEVYSRLFLEFVYTLKSATDRLEAFVFGTRLTRITRQLANRQVEEALRDATDAVVDWGGGTRIGESLKIFNFLWARRVLGQGSVVVVISDGWDRGDPALLEREIARLRRHSDRLIWLNPLLGSPGYEPLTRGIKTILPRVDDFLPIHNLESLEQLSDVLAGLS